MGGRRGDNPHTVPAALGTVEGLRKGHGEARETEPKTPIDDATVEATLPHLPQVVADMVRLQRLTGARPGEIVQLRPSDVDRTGEVWKYVPAEHKTEHHGKRRVIFIGPKGQAILRPYLLRDAEAYCFSPSESERRRLEKRHENRVTPMSCGNVPGKRRKGIQGDQYDSHSYRRAIHRACELLFDMPMHLRAIAKRRYNREAKTWSDVPSKSGRSTAGHPIGCAIQPRQRSGRSSA